MDLIKKYLEEEQNKDTGWRPAQSQRKDKFGNPVKTSNVARSLARQAMQSAMKDLKKGPEAGKRQVEEVEELDELEEPTVQKYITRAKFSTDPKRRAMAQKAQTKLQQKKSPMKTEESELEETDSKLYDKSFDKYADSFTKKGRTTPEKQAIYKKMAQNAYKMLPGKSVKPNLPEEVELDEALRHEIAGQVGRFIGNKIDPVHGDIMHAHGKEAYRQAAFHIRKTISDVKDAVSSLHDRLHKQLRTGGLTTEEVEELEELKRSTIRSYGDKRIRDLEGDKSVEAPFRPKPKSFSNTKRDVISTGLVRAASRLSGVKPTQKEEVEQISELKPRTLASYTSKAADQMANAAIDKSTGAAMGTMGRMSNMPDLAKKGSDKEDKAFQTILKRTKGITSASKRLAKEEVEQIDEISLKDRLAGKTAPVAKSKYNRTKANRPMTGKELERHNRSKALDFEKMPKPDHAKDYTLKHKSTYEDEDDNEHHDYDILHKGKKVGTHHFAGYFGHGTTTIHGHTETGTGYIGDTEHLHHYMKTKKGHANVFGKKEGEQKHAEYVAKHGIKKYPELSEETELGEELSSSQRDTHFSLMNKHGVLAKSAKGANKDAHRMAALDHQMALRNPENSQRRSKALSLSNKLGVKEDVELDESLTKKLAAMGVAATMAASPMAQARVTPGGQSAAQQMSQNVSLGQLPSKETKSSAGFSKEYLKKVASGEHPRPLISKDHANELLKKHYSEEVDLVSKYSKLGEAKFPGFRVRMTSGGPKLPRRSYVPQGDQDPRTGMPLGFSPIKDEPKKPEPTKTKQS